MVMDLLEYATTLVPQKKKSHLDHHLKSISEILTFQIDVIS